MPLTTARTAVIDLPQAAERMLALRSNEQLVATLHRNSDLGFKRNLGLLMARMCGWDAMLYLDDDIRTTPASQPTSTHAYAPIP